VWPKEDGSSTPAYRLLDLWFADYDAASAAVTTDEAGAFFPSVFTLGSGGVRIVFAEVEDTSGAPAAAGNLEASGSAPAGG